MQLTYSTTGSRFCQPLFQKFFKTFFEAPRRPSPANSPPAVSSLTSPSEVSLVQFPWYGLLARRLPVSRGTAYLEYHILPSLSTSFLLFFPFFLLFGPLYRLYAGILSDFGGLSRPSLCPDGHNLNYNRESGRGPSNRPRPSKPRHFSKLLKNILFYLITRK